MLKIKTKIEVPKNTDLIDKLIELDRIQLFSFRTGVDAAQKVDQKLQRVALKDIGRAATSIQMSNRTKAKNRIAFMIVTALAIIPAGIIEHSLGNFVSKDLQLGNGSSNSSSPRGHTGTTTQSIAADALDATLALGFVGEVIGALMLADAMRKIIRTEREQRIVNRITLNLDKNPPTPRNEDTQPIAVVEDFDSGEPVVSQLEQVAIRLPRTALIEHNDYGKLVGNITGDAISIKAERRQIEKVMGKPPTGIQFQSWQIGAASYLARKRILESSSGGDLSRKDQLLADMLLVRILWAQSDLHIKLGSGLENDRRWMQIKDALREHGVTYGLELVQ